MTSEEAFLSIGIEDFRIKHISTFHPNVGKDIVTYVRVARDYKRSDYKYFLFMSTSTTILHPMCITYLTDEEIGIAAVHRMWPKPDFAKYPWEFNLCLRTNLFGVRKDLLPLIGSYYTITTDMERYEFENLSYNITLRVLTYGLRAVVVTPQQEHLDWPDWGKNGSFLINDKDHTLASDVFSTRWAGFALTNWHGCMRCLYPSRRLQQTRLLQE